MKKKLQIFSIVFTFSVVSVSSAFSDQATGHKAELLGILEDSLRSYESVGNYKAVFYKKETPTENSGPAEQIYLKFEKPFKIYMKWLNSGKKGLEVLYERGKHNEKLAIHKPGLLFGLVPVVFLAQDSPWVREGSASFDIEDAGIGTFLFEFKKAVLRGLQENKLEVEWSGGYFDVAFPNTKKDEDYFAHRVVVLFDPSTHLPVSMELFDWEGKRIGLYEYRNLSINLGEDPEFQKTINRHLYKVYAHSH